MRIAIIGGHGKTGQAVSAGLAERGAPSTSLGRADWPHLVTALQDCTVAYLIAPNLHPDEPAYVRAALDAFREAGVGRVVYHSVASPYAPDMPHHLGKAVGEDLVRRSGLRWTILQPGAYLQNLDLSRPVRVPYRVDRRFGFLDLVDLGRAAATVLVEPGHAGATYELATRQASVADLAAEAGVTAERVPDGGTMDGLDDRERTWLSAMFAYYDRYGLLVGLRPLRSLLADPPPAP
ncbi:NAD(P)H-binding protein [Nostocoides sp. F2B08]|uniref:SDR family oxidoreductase n=1 Tax=Nostocoides sp. F2B08 TaxID=2653936 RepID=UPI001263D8CE|nr:NmrA family NAD(P)-binding protein [Tetrasphaera sp. F2B08]KAB7743023.1 NAD(P)H-binding protein [Tetrasphaera sp. F2B08]